MAESEIPETPPVLMPMDALIDPADWRIVTSFTYGGFTYSRGEPMAPIPLSLATALERAGAIARPRADGSIPEPPIPVPQTPNDYLSRVDAQVLRMLLQHPPSAIDLSEIKRLAVGRSDLLQVALEIFAHRGPLVAHPDLVQSSRRAEGLAVELEITTSERDEARQALTEALGAIDAKDLVIAEAEVRLQELTAALAAATPPPEPPAEPA